MDLKINLLKKNKISPYPFFRLLDKMTENQKRFINTGYFLVLKK